MCTKSRLKPGLRGFGVPALAGGAVARSSALKFFKVFPFASAPPPEGGTPNQHPLLNSVSRLQIKTDQTCHKSNASEVFSCPGLFTRARAGLAARSETQSCRSRGHETHSFPLKNRKKPESPDVVSYFFNGLLVEFLISLNVVQSCSPRYPRLER